MNRPVARSLPLPGFDDSTPAAAPGTPAANDARPARAPRAPSPTATVRRLVAALSGFSALAASLEAAKVSAPARASKRTRKAPPEAVAPAAPAPLPLREDLACALVSSDDGAWSVEVLPTTWFGLATLSVVWTAPMEGCGGAWFREELTCDGPAAVAARTSAWLTRYDGPVAVMDVRSLEIEADGRTVLRLRRDGDAWVSIDEAEAKVRLDAALARPVDAERADALDTAHALELQRLNAAGIPTRALDDETLRATRPVFTPAVEAVPTVRGEASDSIARRDPPVRPAPTAAAAPPRAPARRVSRSVEEAVADRPCGSGGPPRAPRETVARAARAPSDAPRRGGR